MITFAHPYAAPTLNIQLRNPELADSELINIRTQVRQAMSGDIHSFRRTPATRNLLLSFTELSKPKVQELIDFLTTSAGDEIQYTDYSAVVWRGYILTNPAEFATIGHKDSTCIEVSTITLEFKGSKV